jgi:DNA invertase Pin-like site-specific DNA recombinase
MARTSHYINSDDNTINLSKRYKAALYIRLSNDDDDKKSESNSVINQRGLLTNFINNSKDIELYDYYIDDGFSGINFNRPAFQKMIQDIKLYDINCVIVKDLSRLGRNYVDVGNYLDNFFPHNNIRFIAINDSIDKIGTDFDMIVPIKNIFNEQYSRDISKKITSSFKVKQLNGEFIGAFASYGYIKDSNNKNKLIIDPYAAKIVKEIFDLFISGKSKSMIAKILNKKGVACPSEYKKQNGMNYNNGHRLELTNYWTYSTIHKALNNEIYTGNMVQNKSIRSDFKTKKNTVNDKENWIRVKNTHEAIIDQETWDKTQILLLKDTRQIDLNHNIHMFAGFVKCGDCGRAMVRVCRHSDGKYDLICSTYSRIGKSHCSQHKIRYNELEDIVLKKIQLLIKEMTDIENDIRKTDNLQKSSKNNNSFEKQYNTLKEQLNKSISLKKGIYEDYKEGILTKQEYLQYKNDYEKDEQRYKNQIETLESNNKTTGLEIIDSDWFQYFKKYKSIQKLDRDIITTFIDHVNIYENNHLKIFFNGEEKINKLREYA